jgi:hypothetical protein
MKTIEEKNRLISEFMGYDIGGNQYRIPFCVSENILGEESNDFYVEQLKFHTSWDWLMPVVEKIEDLECKFEMFPSETKKKYFVAKVMTYANNTFKQNNFFDATGETKIESVHNAVVKFIEWYNENK